MSDNKTINNKNKKKNKQLAPRRGGYPLRRQPNNNGPANIAARKRLVKADQGADGKIISPASTLVCGDGVLKVINVETVLDPLSVQVMFCALVTMGLIRKATDPYAVYQGYFNDVKSLLNGEVGSVPSRLRYLNKILGSVVPKSIPFRLDGVVNYSYKNLQIDLPGNFISVRGKNYYMYVDGAGIFNGYNVQDVPPAYGAQAIINNYLASMQSLASKSRHCEVLRNVSLDKAYLRDASAFGRYSSYFGLAGGVGSLYGSCEFEVPVKSPMLSVLQQFDASFGRAARVLDKCAGDACMNYGIGALDNFNTEYYKGAVPPVVKPIDLYELSMMLALCLKAAIVKTYNNADISDDVFQFDNGFPLTWREFQILVRKQVDWMFADSAPLGQFFAANTPSGRWEAFRQGSNCYPKNPGTIIQIPIIINENLKGLKMCVRPYATRNYGNNRNHITHIPVWGQYTNYVEPVIQYTNSSNTLTDLFQPDDPNTPDLWDGTLGNQVIDLNSAKVTAFAQVWNEWVEKTRKAWSILDTMGGDSMNSPFLQFTRQVFWFEQNADIEIPYFRGYVMESMKGLVETIEEKVPVRQKTLSRKESKETFEIKKRVVLKKPSNPNGSTLLNQAVSSITGIIPITATHIEYLNLFLLPSLEVITLTVPSTTQIQTAYMEPYKFERLARDEASILNSRESELSSLIAECVNGQAGKETALITYMKKLISSNQGAFIGDLFSFIGNTADSLGIPIVAPIAKVASGLAGAVGL